jgi:hypothetical protein
MHRRLNWIHRSLLSALLLSAGISAQAQLVQEPIPHKASKTGDVSNGRTKALKLKPMALPFWDDFSFTLPSKPNNPSDSLWETGASVYVGNGLAINPPTIYAASFDGLNEKGLPYNATDVIANGYTDTLTSRPLLMAGANKSSTWLKFFFQWKGNGDPPDKTDFLAVEFKDDQDKWVERTRIYPPGHTDNTRFYDTMLFVSGDRYYHDNFQFRFRSYGRETGPFDVWNLDYVVLMEGLNPNLTFKDRALSSSTTSLLGEYRAIPLEHYVQGARFVRSFVDINNLSWTTSVGLTTSAYITNYYTGQPPELYTRVLKDTSGVSPGSNRVAFAYVNNLDAGTDVFDLDPLPDSIKMELEVALDSDDDNDLNPSAIFIPGYDLKINDTLRANYTFKDYYAYDDGSAEYSVYLTNPNNRCVVEFPMLTTDYAYLTGFDVYLPDFGVLANQTMDFLVYDRSPAGTGPASTPTLVFNRTVTGQGLDKFLHVGPIIPAIQVKDVFYIGWLAPSIGKPKIGEDYSNNTGNRIYTNDNGTWLQNPGGLTGSLMIRPYVQYSEPPVVGVTPEAEPGTLTVFPNPCQGSCFIRGTYDALTLLNSTGQPVPFNEARENDRTRLSFPTAAPGLYLLRITKGNTSKTEKIIVAD